MKENIVPFKQPDDGRKRLRSHAPPESGATAKVIDLPPQESSRGRVNREEARALVDAGYMPLDEYVKLFGGDR
ncbi:MAG TPA: hypothetical protein VJB97_00360 [Candidatus Paceibacterota bacterium]